MPFISRRRAEITQVPHCSTFAVLRTNKQTTKMTTKWPDRAGSTKLVKGSLKKATKMLNLCSKNGESVSTPQKAPTYYFPNGMISPHLRLFVHTRNGQLRQNSLNSPTAATLHPELTYSCHAVP
jgi:hypothetical protein